MSRRALTADMVPWLERGAATSYGRICFPREARENGPLFGRMHAAGFFFWGDNGETPIITDAGRAAVNGPTTADLLAVEFMASSYP